MRSRLFNSMRHSIHPNDSQRDSSRICEYETTHQSKRLVHTCVAFHALGTQLHSRKPRLEMLPGQASTARISASAARIVFWVALQQALCTLARYPSLLRGFAQVPTLLVQRRD